MSGLRDWQATQLVASFKGMPFEVDGDLKEGGRRIVVHEYPDSENWDNEDLGRAAHSIAVRGYVTGDTADLACEALFQVCNTKGPGLLVLPLRPPVMARCVRVSSTFVADAMGRFNLDMEFVAEAGRAGGVLPDIWFAGAAARASTDAIRAASALFSARFDTLALPSVARDAAAETIRLAAEALDQVLRAAALPAEASSEVGYAIARMSTDSFDLAYAGQKPSNIDDLAYSEDQTSASTGFSGVFSTGLTALAEAAPDKALLFDALTVLSAFREQRNVAGVVTATVTAEMKATAAVSAFVRQTALAVAGEQATWLSPKARPDAVALRARIGGMLAVEIEACDDPDMAVALRAVRDTAINYLSRTAAELPPVRLIDVGRLVPAAVLASAVHGDSTRDSEIVERNSVPHPLFLSGTVEVLR